MDQWIDMGRKLRELINPGQPDLMWADSYRDYSNIL